MITEEGVSTIKTEVRDNGTVAITDSASDVCAGNENGTATVYVGTVGFCFPTDKIGTVRDVLSHLLDAVSVPG